MEGGPEEDEAVERTPAERKPLALGMGSDRPAGTAAGPAQSTSGSLKLCVKFASPFMTDDIAYFALCVLWKFQ